MADVVVEKGADQLMKYYNSLDYGLCMRDNHSSLPVVTPELGCHLLAVTVNSNSDEFDGA